MKLTIIGHGMFGTFLTNLFAPYAEITEDSDNIILVVPYDAYEEVAKAHAGKHLINVCSVQREPNKICLKYSKNVTGIHPLFGPRSPRTNRTAILTHECEKTKELLELFEKVGTEVYSNLPNGKSIDGDLHDQMMAVTHLAGLQAAEQLKSVVEKADWIPEKFVPTSFRRIRDFVDQCGDFSPGTLSSMKANPYI
jgi:prephenate dehydrogenase